MTTPSSTNRSRTDHRLSRVVAVALGKGGVGKTTTTATLGAMFAAGGLVSLLVDLDPQANLELDLGYEDRTDSGEGLVRGLWKHEPLAVLHDVRPGLHVIPGGSDYSLLRGLEDTATEPGGLPARFASLLAETVEHLAADIVLIDSPPGEGLMQDMALRAARYILVPINTDDGSWRGLSRLGPRVVATREYNPDLDYLGALIFANQTSATNVLRHTITSINDNLGGRIPLFRSRIRHSESIAQITRSQGQLVHELPDQSGTTGHLRRDWDSLTTEVLTRIAEHESRAAQEQAR